MDRRGFLTTLFGASAAAIILPKIDLAVAKQAPVWRDIEALEWKETYTAALNEAHGLFLREMASLGVDIRPEHVDLFASLLGMQTAEGITLNTWKNVQGHSIGAERTLIPAMEAMADALVTRGIDRFGTLPLPQHGLSYAGTRGPLRMIVQYDIADDLQLVRFDVIGGSSPVGQRIGQKYRNDGLKRIIKRSLGTYPNPSRLPV